MRLDPQDLKAIVEGVGKLIDARAQTTEINLKAEIKTSETKLRREIKIANMELKTDINNLRTGAAKKLTEHEERLRKLEKTDRKPLKN